MPTYEFEAMDGTGQEIKDVVEAPNEEEAQATIRQMGYFVTKIAERKARAGAARKKKGGRKKTFSIGRVKGKVLTTFTRQWSILQDAGLPILRSLRILENQANRPVYNALKRMDEEHLIEEVGAQLRDMMPWCKGKK